MVCLQRQRTWERPPWLYVERWILYEKDWLNKYREGEVMSHGNRSCLHQLVCHAIPRYNPHPPFYLCLHAPLLSAVTFRSLGLTECLYTFQPSHARHSTHHFHLTKCFHLSHARPPPPHPTALSLPLASHTHTHTATRTPPPCDIPHNHSLTTSLAVSS